MTYGNSPRNPVVGPGLAVVDLSLAKSFSVQNGQQLQFRWEAFNAFNNATVGEPQWHARQLELRHHQQHTAEQPRDADLSQVHVLRRFTETQVQVLAIVTKADAQAWLDEQRTPASARRCKVYVA